MVTFFNLPADIIFHIIDQIERERVDPNRKDCGGSMALFYAVMARREKVVQLMLRDDRVDPSAARRSGTPRQASSTTLPSCVSSFPIRAST